MYLYLGQIRLKRAAVAYHQYVHILRNTSVILETVVALVRFLSPIHLISTAQTSLGMARYILSRRVASTPFYICIPHVSAVTTQWSFSQNHPLDSLPIPLLNRPPPFLRLNAILPNPLFLFPVLLIHRLRSHKQASPPWTIPPLPRVTPLHEAPLLMPHPPSSRHPLSQVMMQSQTRELWRGTC